MRLRKAHRGCSTNGRRTNISPYDSIALEFSGLGEGETQAGQVCPSCQGGPSKETSLSVSRRDGVLVFVCHRASCTFRGAVNASGRFTGTPSTGQEAKEKPRYPRVPTSELSRATIKFLSTKYSVPESVLSGAELRWSGDGDGYLSRRVCFPIRGVDLKERGTCYRSYEAGVVPKAVIELRTSEDIKAAWYKEMRKSDKLFIVEDQMSAIKLSPHVHAVALLGTEISDTLVEEIKTQEYKEVRIMLDNDATDAAIKHQLRLRHKINNIQVRGLPKDIKDMNTGEFNDWLSFNVH